MQKNYANQNFNYKHKILLSMKTIFFTLAFTLFFVISHSQTTMTEYNYLIKGYKIQQESGLDMKKGYSIHEYGKWGKSYGSYERKTTFYGLFKDKETKPCALLVILKRTDTDYERYACIPAYHSSKAVWNSAYKDWQNTDLTSAYAWGMIQFISYQFSKDETDEAVEELENSLKQ